MRLQCASASPFSNRVPDERAVQGLSPSKGFFFRPLFILPREAFEKTFVMRLRFSDGVPDERAVRGSSPNKGIVVFFSVRPN